MASSSLFGCFAFGAESHAAQAKAGHHEHQQQSPEENEDFLFSPSSMPSRPNFSPKAPDWFLNAGALGLHDLALPVASSVDGAAPPGTSHLPLLSDDIDPINE